MAASEPWLTLGRSPERCRDVFFDPRHDVVVAADPDAPLGFAIADPRGLAGAPYLKALGVDPKRRGEGIGELLLRHVEREIGEPHGNLFLCVSSFNLRARAFYEKHGYVAIGEIQAFIIPGASEVIMRRRLTAADEARLGPPR
jgi:ribosomal protein S18 acetylase RimI-like enzyme